MARLFQRLKLGATFWLSRRLPPCADLTRTMSESLERELTVRERVTLRLHFLMCVYCERYLAQLKLIREAVRRRAEQPDAAPDATLSPATRERISKALRG
jgi:hypothetical protein